MSARAAPMGPNSGRRSGRAELQKGLEPPECPTSEMAQAGPVQGGINDFGRPCELFVLGRPSKMRGLGKVRAGGISGPEP
jgi:hypothetical protein